MNDMTIRIIGSIVLGVLFAFWIASLVGRKHKQQKNTRANWVKLNTRKATEYERWGDGDGQLFGNGPETTPTNAALHLGENRPAEGSYSSNPGHEANVRAQVDAALNVRMDAPVETATNYEATTYVYTRRDDNVVDTEWWDAK